MRIFYSMTKLSTAENRRKRRRLVSHHVSMTSHHGSAMEKAEKAAANVANVDAPRGSSYIELLSRLTDMCTTDVDLPMSTSNLKKRRGGIATENVNSALGLATWLTNAINSRLTRLNKDRSRILRVRYHLTMALPHRRPESS